MKKIPDIISIIIKKLRSNMTLSEKLLWGELKAKKLHGLKFVRQVALYVYTENSGLDRYIIPDFLCKEYKIIIELDGNIHNIKEIYNLDKTKEELVKKLGYKVIRIKNQEILNNLNNTLSHIVASFPRRGREFKGEGKITEHITEFKGEGKITEHINKNSKIAIYGGAFNPPTLGHLHVIERVFKCSDIEKIIIVPDGLRLDKDYRIEENHRKELINIFIEELNKNGFNVEIETHFLEGKNNSDTTTYEVDKYFIKKLEHQPFHIFGTDISSGIKDWSGNPNKYIQKELKKLFIPRAGYNFDNFDLENYKLIETSLESDISSTKVKENIKNKLKINKLVTEKIEEYINNNNLY